MLSSVVEAMNKTETILVFVEPTFGQGGGQRESGAVE